MAKTNTVGLGTLWIVTTARPISELGDICFEASPSDLAFQVLGGLKPDEIIGWFDNYSEANQIALQELHRVGAYINGRPRKAVTHG